MSICENCTKAKDVFRCVTQINVGVAEADTDYIILLENMTTGRVDKFEVTSDGSGNISFRPGFELACHVYQIKVVEKNEFFTDVEFTVADATLTSCVYFNVVQGAADEQTLFAIV